LYLLSHEPLCFTPKEYCCDLIRPFALAAFRADDGCLKALYLGYCDYQHLTKDCKEFTGLTPAAFHREKNRAPERNFGHKET
jgi:hypothetical protein